MYLPSSEVALMGILIVKISDEQPVFSPRFFSRNGDTAGQCTVIDSLTSLFSVSFLFSPFIFSPARKAEPQASILQP
jgi:hypothetical protein